MNLNKTYNYLSAVIELSPGWVLLFAMSLISAFKVYRVSLLQFIIQMISITFVVVEPIIYRKKFTVFQRGAVTAFNEKGHPVRMTSFRGAHLSRQHHFFVL